MDLLSGVGGSCPSTARVSNTPRRDSSISLEDSAYNRHTPDPTLMPPYDSIKSLVNRAESPIFEEPQEASSEDGCPHLPSEPSRPSSPSVVAPMEVYLRYEESHELRMLRFGSTTPKAMLSQGKQTSEPKVVSSVPETSSWQIVDSPRTLDRQEKAPSTPVLQPALSPRPTGSPANIANTNVEEEDTPSASSDSDVSELSLSTASHASSGSIDVADGVVGQWPLAKKTKRTVVKPVKKRARVERA
ncbi:hypothetical protein FSARC_8345 [Fusarium sarcochroum]|uniref:Uncharacterized protein n=1 Tax=Fusarium sarcochroum TaxID=1208366 RepID=A0A8H4TTB8_9HYPO|nr:hypothetical protein FSARC_8345 [Fusarium sarcochroum]